VNKILLPNNYQNKNESKEHYELKQIAKYILKSKNCNVIGEEINIGKG
jgi:competence CoiA-like predicted nuclease